MPLVGYYLGITGQLPGIPSITVFDDREWAATVNYLVDGNIKKKRERSPLVQHVHTYVSV